MEQTNNPEITPKQAFDILAQTAVQFRGTRAEHELIEKALRTLAPLVEQPKSA
jgi:hypothetical protein